MADDDSLRSGGYGMSDFGISAGVGGLVTRVHGRKARLHAQYMQEREWERQDTELQRKVADAKAAGLHPLFALGGSASGGSPISMSFGENPAPYAADAVRSIFASVEERKRRTMQEAEDSRVRRMEDELHAARLRLTQSEIDKNEAISGDYATSALARGVQMSNQLRATPDVTFPKGQEAGQEWVQTPFGLIRADKRMASAQSVQDRYGDIAEQVFGLANMVRDISSTIISNYQSELKRPYTFDDMFGKVLTK